MKTKFTTKPTERGWHWAYESGWPDRIWWIVYVSADLKHCKDVSYGCALKEKSGTMRKTDEFSKFVKITEPE